MKKNLCSFLSVFFIVTYIYLKLHNIFNFKNLCIYIFFVVLFNFFVIIKKYLKKKWDFKKLKEVFIWGIITTFVTVIAKDVNFLFPYMIAINFLDDNYSDMIKYFAISSLIMYILTLLGCFFGFFDEIQYFRKDKIRYSLGFYNPNSVFLNWIPVVLGMYYVIKNKYVYVSISFILSTILFFLTDCRIGYGCVIIFLVYILLNNFKIVKRILSCKIFKYLFIIFFILSILLALLYGNNYDNFVNKLFSNRLVYWNYHICDVPFFSFFGNSMRDYLYTVDNTYLVIFKECGLFVFLIYFYIMLKSYELLSFDEKFIMIVFLIYGMFESNAMIGSINFLLPIQLIKLINFKLNKKELLNMKKQEELISIIVPIYNVENYLSKCIESILNQTYKNLEIILVDDGSKDNSGKICDNFAQKDERIKVIHQKNSGVAQARNTGVKNCTGNYIGFVDPDDYISEYMYEYLYNNIIKYDADISMCQYTTCNESHIKFKNCNKTCCYKSEQAIKYLLMDRKIQNFLWNKLYKKSLFNNIVFPGGMVYEDIAVMYKLFEKSNVIANNMSIHYYYFQRTNSICNGKISKKKIYDYIDINEKRKKNLEEKVEKKLLDASITQTTLIAHFMVARNKNYNLYMDKKMINFYEKNIKFKIYYILKMKVKYLVALLILRFNRKYFYMIFSK